MHRIMIRWTFVIALTVSTIGCATDSPPMTVLMPTYSFNRDVIETAGHQPVNLDPVAAAEP